MKSTLNSRMLFLTFNKIVNTRKLHISLQNVLSKGLVFDKNCWFLKELYEKQNHIKESDFIDKTGFECFINSIHIDDYVEKDLFEQTILFAKGVIELWNSKNSSLGFNIILSETDFGFNLKFHTLRIGEQWINEEDIDNFQEAIIVFNNCAPSKNTL